MDLEFSQEDYEQIGISNLSDCIYNILKRKILALHILPGKIINIKDIEDALGVSRTPVRDAISRLGKDRLIDIIPQRETKVSMIDADGVDQERFIRWAVEKSVVRECCGKCTDEHYVMLNKYIDKQEEAAAANDITAEIQTDNAFHSYVFEIAGKKQCWNIINSNSYNYARIRLLAYKYGDIEGNKCDQHRNIARYIFLNKPAEAVAEVENHLNQVMVEKQRIIDKHPEFFTKTNQ